MLTTSSFLEALKAGNVTHLVRIKVSVYDGLLHVNSKAANDLATKQKGHQQPQYCPSFLTILQALHLFP